MCIHYAMSSLVLLAIFHVSLGWPVFPLFYFSISSEREILVVTGACLTGLMPFLSSNQQCQSTRGIQGSDSNQGMYPTFLSIRWLIREGAWRSLYTGSLTPRPLSLCVTHTQPFYGPFSGTTWVSRRQKKKFLLDFMVQGEISPTIRLGATPSGLISNQPPLSPHFYTGCSSCRRLPVYCGLGQAPNMLACIPSGLVLITMCERCQITCV